MSAAFEGYTQMSRYRTAKGVDMKVAKRYGVWKRISTATWLRLIDRNVPWDCKGIIYAAEKAQPK